MLATSSYNFYLLHPDAAKEWHPTKNGKLIPKNVTPRSKTKAWWKCKEGHEWNTTIGNRARGSSCPHCKSFGFKFPKIAQEWHKKKNGLLSPLEVSSGSGKKVWWKCVKGHEWEARVTDRKQGGGCPYCAGKKVGKDNSLAFKFPVIAKEWDKERNRNLTPQQVTSGSGKKVWWLCKKKHSWQAQINSRTRGKGCPHCTRHSSAPPATDYNLKVMFPALVKELHSSKNENLKPENIYPKSGKNLWWKCKKGHEWQAKVVGRASGSDCPYCSGQRVSSDNNLQLLMPEVALEWHPNKNGTLKSNQVTPGSNKKVWWLCKKNHEWNTTVGSRGVGRTGCPLCSKQTSRLEIRVLCELRSIFEDVNWRHKFSGLECDIYIPKYKVAVEIDGYPWHKDKLQSDRRKEANLKIDGIRLFRLRDDRLPKISSEDVMYADRKNPLIAIKNLVNTLLKEIDLSKKHGQLLSKYNCLSTYKNEEEYKQILSFLPGVLPEQSLLTLFPTVAKDWNYAENDPLKPELYSPGSNLKVWWQCRNKHEWQATIDIRTRRGDGCPFCSGRFATKEKNLKVLYPEIAKQLISSKNGNIKPEIITPKSSKKFWWKCRKGHEWEAKVNDRTAGTGCPYCAGKRITKENSLLAKFPKVAKEWHPSKNGNLTPDKITARNGKKAWWLCENKHEWQTTVAHRTRGTGCPHCRKENFKTVRKRK
jgi:hypothetical protein